MFMLKSVTCAKSFAKKNCENIRDVKGIYRKANYNGILLGAQNIQLIKAKLGF